MTMLKKYIILILSFLVMAINVQGQLTKSITYDFDTQDGVYCDISNLHWFSPTVQAIQDRLDLQDFGGLQLDSLMLIKLFNDVSTQSLSYTLYQPKTNYSNKKPLIIFAHGGAYVIGGRESLSTVMLCEEFARRGYATASIEYRLKAISTLSMVEAGYMAMQDGNAAIKYFRANADKFNIDPNRIFIAGISAGGILALHAAHFDDHDDMLGMKHKLNDLYGCHRCTGDYVSMDNEVAGVISIVSATTSPNILDDVPTLHIYTPTDSVVPANRGIPLAHLKSSTKLPGLVKNIIGAIQRPECFGPIYIKNNYQFTNHTFKDINALTGIINEHSFITAQNGQPSLSGLKTIDVINEWLMDLLKPQYSIPKALVSNNKWKVFNLPKNTIKHTPKANSNYVYQSLSNNSFQLQSLKPGDYQFEVELTNDLGLSSLASISTSSDVDSIPNPQRSNKPAFANSKSNYLIFGAIGLSLACIGFIFYKYY